MPESTHISRDFRQKCQNCGAFNIKVLVPNIKECREPRPYLKNLPEYVCKECIIKAQRDYIQGTLLENVPLLNSMPWIYEEEAIIDINKKLGITYENS